MQPQHPTAAWPSGETVPGHALGQTNENEEPVPKKNKDTYELQQSEPETVAQTHSDQTNTTTNQPASNDLAATTASLQQLNNDTDPPITPTLANRTLWVANDHPPVATRGGLTVTVYLKKDDTANYYIMVESTHGAVGANLIINNSAYGAITPRSTAFLQKTPCLSGAVAPSPEVTLQGF